MGNRAIVQFDIDGVLADFHAGYRAVQRKLGKPLTLAATWDAYWGQAEWEYIRTSVDFYETMPALVTPYVFDRISALQDQHDVYFVTNRGGLHAKYQTQFWLMANGVENPAVIISGKKGEFAKVVGATHAIDDKAGNAVYLQYESPKTKSYLLDASYNQFDQKVLGTKVVRVATVDEFLDAVEADA